jgi:preprotein translocase subunit YajC
MLLNYILLEAAGAAATTPGKGIDIKNLLLIASFILVFYFFMIRPQQKRQKEQRGFVDQLAKGDQVITIGGVHGTIYEVNDQVVVLEVDNKGSKITFSKNAISIDATKKQTQQKK